MKQENLNNLSIFLQRVQLNGNEVPAFNEILKELAELANTEKEVKNVSGK